MTRAGTRAMVALVTPAARFALLGVLALSIAGCGPGGAWIAGVIGLLLGFAACSQTHGGRDADTADDSGPATPDAGRDVGPGDGHRERCCEDGVITTCFCPGGDACNYGLFEDCGDGTCGFFEGCPDAG